MSWRRDLEERLGEQEDATDLFWRKHQAESGTADASPGDWRARAFPDVSLTDDQLADLRAGLEPRPISNQPTIAGWDLMSEAQRDAIAAARGTNEELAVTQAVMAAVSPKIDAREARRQSAGRNWSGAADSLPPSAQAMGGLRVRHVRMHEGNIPASIDRVTDGPAL